MAIEAIKKVTETEQDSQKRRDAAVAAGKQQVEAAGLENPGQRLVTSVETLELEREENQWLKAAEG